MVRVFASPRAAPTGRDDPFRYLIIHSVPPFFHNDVAKEKFREILAKQRAFSQVELVTFCLMGNHFIPA